MVPKGYPLLLEMLGGKRYKPSSKELKPDGGNPRQFYQDPKA